MSETAMVKKRRKKLKTMKTKATHGKLKKQTVQQMEQNVEEEIRRADRRVEKRKIQLTQEFEENEREVMTLLESTSLLSASSNSSHRDEDNKSPNERFFCGIKDLQQADTNKQAEIIESEESLDDETVSKNSTDNLSTATRSLQQPTLAATFINIEADDSYSLVRVEQTAYCTQQKDLIYTPSSVLDTVLGSFPVEVNLNKNTIRLLNRFIMEFKCRKQKIDKNILNILKNHQKFTKFYSDDLLYKTYCEFKFKPIFIEPSLDSLAIPSKKLLNLHLKDLRFTEHALLQEEHRLANDLELLYEHRQQRLQEKITEKLYADLQIERNILYELLSSAENGCRSDMASNKEKKAKRLEHHLHKVKALREKLYDEEFTNKQLLQDILNSWMKLKSLRNEQQQQFTRLKLRIKIEDFSKGEGKNRQKLWKQRFESDLNEIYREHLEEYYRAKRLRQQHKKPDDYAARPRKPNLEILSSELSLKYNRCFLNPKEPRINIERVSSNTTEFFDLPGPSKLQTYFMRIFFDNQMVGETRCYRLERDLSLTINEKIGIILNRRLPKDIRIKVSEIFFIIGGRCFLCAQIKFYRL